MSARCGGVPAAATGLRAVSLALADEMGLVVSPRPIVFPFALVGPPASWSCGPIAGRRFAEEVEDAVAEGLFGWLR